METQLTRQIITAVYDSKVKQHMSPIFCRTTEEAIRMFGAAAKKEGHEFREFAEDYTLWQIGTFIPETGAIQSNDRLQIASASDFTNKN